MIPFEMTQGTLHWRVLLKYIKSQVAINGFILERSIITHYVPEGLSRSEQQVERSKVEKSLQGLITAGYLTVSMGQTEHGVGRCITLLKYPSGKVDESEGADDATE